MKLETGKFIEEWKISFFLEAPFQFLVWCYSYVGPASYFTLYFNQYELWTHFITYILNQNIMLVSNAPETNKTVLWATLGKKVFGEPWTVRCFLTFQESRIRIAFYRFPGGISDNPERNQLTKKKKPTSFLYRKDLSVSLSTLMADWVNPIWQTH